MIAISTNEGVLRVHAEVRIPSSESGAWDAARCGKLVDLISDYVEAAELVDETTRTWPRYKYAVPRDED